MKKFSFFLNQAVNSLSLKLGFVFGVVTTLSTSIAMLLTVLTLGFYIVWQPLPYPEQAQIYKLDYQRIDQNNEVKTSKFIHPAAVDLYNRSRDEKVELELALSRYSQEVLSSLPSQPKINTMYVTPEWFSIFASKLILGRVFDEKEAVGSFVPGAVISSDTWKKLYQKDVDVLKQSITVNGKQHPIIGVLDSNFFEPEVYQVGRGNQVWLPWDFNNSDYTGYWGLADDNIVMLAKSNTELYEHQIGQVLSVGANEKFKQASTGDKSAQDLHVNVIAHPLQQALSEGSYGTIILLFAGGLGLVIIAVTNIANLMMARTVAQLRKLSIAAALGAKKKHLFYSLLAESSLLVGLSMLLGLAISAGALSLVKQYCAEWIPRTQELQINGFTIAVTLLLGIGLALLLGWLNSRLVNYSELKTGLQSGGKGTGGQISKTSRNLLIGCQISIATLLVSISSALIIDSFNQINKKLGIETKELMLMEFSIATLDWKGWPHYVPDVKRLQQNLNGLPEVKSMSFSRSPLDDIHQFPVQDVESNQDYFPFHRNVDNYYFDVTGQPILLGRGFSKADVEQSTPVAIVNETFAGMLATSYEQVLGKKISVQNGKPVEIVGIVKDLKLPNKRIVPPRFYVPNYGTGMWALIKIEPNQSLSRLTMIDQLRNVNNQFVLTKYEAMEESLFKANFNSLFTLVSAAALSIITIALAGLGLFGVLSYSTQVRRVEISTRRAIGAKNKTIIAMVLRDNLIVVTVGMLIGIILCLAFFNLLANGVISNSVSGYLPSIGATTLSMIALVVIASYLPLRRFFKQPITMGLREL